MIEKAFLADGENLVTKVRTHTQYVHSNNLHKIDQQSNEIRNSKSY